MEGEEGERGGETPEIFFLLSFMAFQVSFDRGTAFSEGVGHSSSEHEVVAQPCNSSRYFSHCPLVRYCEVSELLKQQCYGIAPSTCYYIFVCYQMGWEMC